MPGLHLTFVDHKPFVQNNSIHNLSKVQKEPNWSEPERIEMNRIEPKRKKTITRCFIVIRILHFSGISGVCE